MHSRSSTKCVSPHREVNVRSGQELIMARGGNVLIFAGSTRAASLNRKVARCAWAAAHAARIDATWLDLREYSLPLYDGDLETSVGIPRHVAALRAQLKQHPVWLIASPDYNSSISPLVKNAIDWVSRPFGSESYLTCFKDRVVGLMSSAPDSSGGAHGLPHLRQVLTHLGARVLDTQFLVPKGDEAFDEQGALRERARQEELQCFIRDAVERAKSSQVRSVA
jgi:NAD(P)H-dependent FMN reductase